MLLVLQSLCEFLNKTENHKFYCAVLFFAQHYATHSVVFLIPHFPSNDTSNHRNPYHFPLCEPAGSAPLLLEFGPVSNYPGK